MGNRFLYMIEICTYIHVCIVQIILNLFHMQQIKDIFLSYYSYISLPWEGIGPSNSCLKTTVASSAMVKNPSLFKSHPFLNMSSVTANCGTLKNRFEYRAKINHFKIEIALFWSQQVLESAHSLGKCALFPLIIIW